MPTHRTVAPSGTDTDVALRRHMAPHVRVLVVALVLVTCGVAFQVLTMTWLGRVDRPVESVATQLSPALEALDEVDRGLGRAQYLFSSTVVEEDPEIRVAAIEELRRQLSSNEDAWRRYLRSVADLPGEAALIVAYEEAVLDQQSVIGTIGLALVTADDPAELLRTEEARTLLESQRGAQDAVQELKVDVYGPVLASELAAAETAVDTATRQLFVVFIAMAFLVVGISAIAFRSAWRTDRQQLREQAERTQHARRNEFEARLYRALQMGDTEDFAYDVVAQGLRETLPQGTSELLVADSATVGFRRVVASDGRDRSTRCNVIGPSECPAAQRGDRLGFGSATDLDACPHLRVRAPEDTTLSAVCQPVSIAGRSLAVIHVTSNDGLPDDEALSALDLIARRAGDRIALLRAMAESESQARTDPLTGLLNRRSLESGVRALDAAGRPYCVAYGDLDQFKPLNDTWGHDAGDQALRLFARLLVEHLRPDDLAARFGGEEFLAVLPECTLDEAARVVERVRHALATRPITGEVPAFTVSFGVACSDQAENFTAVTALADGALLQAKEAGRDRVLVAGRSGTATEMRALEPGDGSATSTS